MYRVSNVPVALRWLARLRGYSQHITLCEMLVSSVRVALVAVRGDEPTSIVR